MPVRKLYPERQIYSLALIVLAGLIMLLAGCATGPSPEELERRAEAQRQEATRKQAEEARKREEAARKQAELQAKLAKAQELEQAGLAADNGGKLREALKQYMAALESLGGNAPTDVDVRLRDRIIAVGQRLNPPPAVPDDAERYLIRGSALMKNATTDEDYDKVLAEFQKAVAAAPWWGDAYFNLALIQEKAGDPALAIRNLQRYLLAAPKAADAGEVKRKIIALEVLAEELAPIKRLEGEWVTASGSIQRLMSRGKSVKMVQVQPSPTASQAGWKPGDVGFYGVFEGKTLRGKFANRYTTARDKRCWGERLELPMTGSVNANGDTITIRSIGGTYNMDTCTRLSDSEATDVYRRKPQ